MMRLQRLLALLQVLGGSQRVPLQTLAQRFEVSRRTVIRDLETLNEAGFPIVTYPGPGGGAALMDGYKVGPGALSVGDAGSLYAALSGLHSIDGDGAVSYLLAKLVPESPESAYAKSGYVMDLSSWFTDSIIQRKLSSLHQAMEERRCVEIDYLSPTGRSRRVVEPHKLVFKQAYWYLYAYCRTRSAFRLFRLSRISSWDISEEAFQPRPMEPLQFTDRFGANPFSTPRFDVVLTYRAQDECALTDRLDATLLFRAEESDTGEARFSASNLDWVADLVCSLADKVQIKAPPALQEAVQQRMKKW